MGNAKTVITGVLFVAALAGLAAVAMKNQALEERVKALEKAGGARSPSTTATPASGPAPAAALPSGDASRLEERIAQLEKRAAAGEPSPVSPTPPSLLAPAATETPGDPATEEAPKVPEEFRKAVLAVLKEQNERQKEIDTERSKMWQEGMVERQIVDLEKRLSLSSSQVEQIRAIFKDGWAKVSKMWGPMFSNASSGQKVDWNQVRTETEKVVADVDTQAKSLLTVEQGAAYDEWRKEQNQQFRFFGGGSGQRR